MHVSTALISSIDLNGLWIGLQTTGVVKFDTFLVFSFVLLFHIHKAGEQWDSPTETDKNSI